MIIPEDGQLPSISNSNLNVFNNIMIVKVDDKSRKAGETTYQLATINRSNKGNVWPADNFVSKLIPDLLKVKASDESNKDLNTKERFDVPCYKTTVDKSRTFRRSGRNNYRSAGMRQPNHARKRNWDVRTEVHHKPQPFQNNRRCDSMRRPYLARNWNNRTEEHNRPQLANNIKPWMNGWENQSKFKAPEVNSSLHIHPPTVPYSIPYDNVQSNMPREGLLGRCPPGEFRQGPSLLGPCPSANNSLGNHYSGFAKTPPPGVSFSHPEPHLVDSSERSYNNYVSQSRQRWN